MPIFDYQCTNCGEVVEVILLQAEKPPKKCSRCGGKMKKLIPSSIGIAFKGPGFYVTDHRKSSSSPSSTASSKPSLPKSSRSNSSPKSGKSDRSDKSD